MPRGKAFDIEPRELFVILQSLGAAMDLLKGGRSYDDIPREVIRQHNEAGELFLKLEEVWDRLSDKDRAEAAAKPFDPRRLGVDNPRRRTVEAKRPGMRVKVNDDDGQWYGTIVSVRGDNATVESEENRPDMGIRAGEKRVVPTFWLSVRSKR